MAFTELLEGQILTSHCRSSGDGRGALSLAVVIHAACNSFTALRDFAVT